jgi:hypothetical protein
MLQELASQEKHAVDHQLCNTLLSYCSCTLLCCSALCCRVGERSNLKAGQPSAATAHLYFNLAVPQLLSAYLPAYARFSVCTPGLYLLANSPGVSGPDSTLEALAAEVQGTTAR